MHNQAMHILLAGLLCLVTAAAAHADERTVPTPSNASDRVHVSLEISKLRHIDERLNDVALRITNVSSNPIALQMSVPWEMAELVVTRDGIVVRPGKKESSLPTSCSYVLHLAPGESSTLRCGERVSDVSYAVSGSWALRAFGYRLSTPGHYVIYAKVSIPLILPSEPSLVLHVQTPTVETDIPQ